MGYKVVWTKRAEIGYDKIVRYLLEKWLGLELCLQTRQPKQLNEKRRKLTLPA